MATSERPRCGRRWLAALGLMGPHASPALAWLSIPWKGRGSVSRIEGTSRPADTAGMERKPEPPPKPIRWSIYRIAAKAIRLGTVEAPDDATAIEKAPAEFKVPANRLMAIRR